MCLSVCMCVSFFLLLSYHLGFCIWKLIPFSKFKKYRAFIFSIFFFSLRLWFMLIYMISCPMFETLLIVYYFPICFAQIYNFLWAYFQQVTLVVKNPPANAGDLRDTGLISALVKSPEGGHGSPHQYSCPENPTDRGAWQATVLSTVLQRVRNDWSDLAPKHTFSSILSSVFH